jgi:dihydrofolate synthase/folylpolyglutamate synthase
MRLDDWLAHQQAQHPNAIELGLDRVRAVATRLGILPWRIPSVIVGGTNGKGSTVAYLTALARHSGLRVGTYTSPHLQRYNERIAIDGAPILDESLIALFERIEAARHGVALTFFEYGTLAAYLAFIEAKVDIAIIEVGLGGRLDATNIIDADVAVLTSVGLDHMEWLGPTREEIGREKAGIFRAGSPVVLGSQDMPQSVHEALRIFDCQAIWPPEDWSAIPEPALSGPVQRLNAAAAISAFEAVCTKRVELGLQTPLSFDARARALQSAQLRGRCQRIEDPFGAAIEWVLDVAHNPDAARELAKALATLPPRARVIGVVGILADKNADEIVGELTAVIDAWVLCALDGARGRTAEQLRAELSPPVSVIGMTPSVAEACVLARAIAGSNDRIVVLGSFHVVGPALDWLGV